MENSDKFIIFLFTMLLVFVVVATNYENLKHIKQLEEKIDNFQPVINTQICEELLPYGYRGRQHFVCYKGDEIEYTNIEQYIIKQWKSHK